MLIEGDNKGPVDYDPVMKPKHYTLRDYEAIDIIRETVSDPVSYLHGNVLKYMLRWPHKTQGDEDLRKAWWYLGKMIREVQDEQETSEGKM